jgi:hypothetical protein
MKFFLPGAVTEAEAEAFYERIRQSLMAKVGSRLHDNRIQRLRLHDGVVLEVGRGNTRSAVASVVAIYEFFRREQYCVVSDCENDRQMGALWVGYSQTADVVYFDGWDRRHSFNDFEGASPFG